MSQTVITVDRLSKAYQIGPKERHGRTFREAMTETLTAPFRRLRSIAAGGNGDGAAEETFWALKDVSFAVKRGEVVGIIGRNGAGKSTLLKVLSRITEPTSGQVRLRGRVASLLEVGTGFHPELTGRENIFLNGAVLGMKRAEITRKFDEIVAFAEVEKFLDTPVKRYSSGMYVRLAFAVAAHLEPEILIVDEVLAVGDAEFQKKCLGKMHAVSKGEGRTVLFVSHHMAAVQALCDRAIGMGKGTVLQYGSVDQVVCDYLGRSSEPVGEFSAAQVGDFLVEGVAVKGTAGEIRTLDDMTVRLLLKPSKDIVSFGVRLYIEAKDGKCLADLEPYPAHARCPLPAGRRSRVDISLSRLPLRPGRYSVRMILRDDGRFVQWELEQAVPFEVEPSLNALNNNARPPHLGPVAVEFRISSCLVPPEANLADGGGLNRE